MTDRHDVMRTKKAIDAMTIARARQVVNHGFNSTHDDKMNPSNQLSFAAASYAVSDRFKDGETPNLWPWDSAWWKPSKENRKRDIEKACALLLAEWERLDRIEEKAAEGAEKEISQ